MFSLPFFEQFCWCTLPIFSSTCHEYCPGTCSIYVVNHDPSQNRRNADLSNAWEHWKLELAPGGCIFHGTVSCLERFAFWSFYLPFLNLILNHWKILDPGCWIVLSANPVVRLVCKSSDRLSKMFSWTWDRHFHDRWVSRLV